MLGNKSSKGAIDIILGLSSLLLKFGQEIQKLDLGDWLGQYFNLVLVLKLLSLLRIKEVGHESQGRSLLFLDVVLFIEPMHLPYKSFKFYAYHVEVE